MNNPVYKVLVRPQTKVQAPLPFVAVTLLGVGIEWPDWYKGRIGLFEAITLPSIARQRGLTAWIVFADACAPAAALERLTASLSALPNAYLVAVDADAPTRMVVGEMGPHGLLYDVLLDEGIVTDVGAYYLSANIDDDDAWHEDVAFTIAQAAMVEARAMMAWDQSDCAARSDVGYQLTHADGVIFTLANGFMWYPASREATHLRYPYISMGCFLLTRFSSGISIMSSRHSQWPEFAKVAGFRSQELSAPQPMWLYTQHDLAFTFGARQGRLPGSSEPFSVANDELAPFGVSAEKAAATVGQIAAIRDWRPVAAAVPPNRMYVNELMGLRFLISALGRQEMILQSKAADPETQERLNVIRERKRRLIAKRRALSVSPQLH